MSHLNEVMYAALAVVLSRFKVSSSGGMGGGARSAEIIQHNVRSTE